MKRKFTIAECRIEEVIVEAEDYEDAEQTVMDRGIDTTKKSQGFEIVEVKRI